VVVLGDALWRSRFAADPDVIGASIMLDGAMRTVVGVMPAGFDFPNRADLWLPLGIRLDPRNGRSRPVIARLRDGVSLEQSRAMFASFLATLPAPDGEVESSVQPLKAYFVNKVEHTLGVFMGAVAFVLLIACANVANLMLMRGAARDRELTVRSALGAGRARIMHQLLVESVVLALVGGAAGVLLARAGVDAFLMLAPSGRIPRADSIRIDGVVLGASAAVSLFVGIAFGLLPSLFATRHDLRGTLSVAALSSSRSRSRVRSLLVVGQISLALVLLTGAGLLLRSFRNMRAVDLGFTPANVLTMTVDLPTTTYAQADAMQALHTRVLERLQASPEVDAAGAVNWRPFGTMILSGDFAVENGPDLSSGYWADKLAVSSDYFRAMGIRLLRGRSFTSGDLADAPGVVIVSRTVADRFWPDGDAVGGRLSLQTDPAPTDWLTVVGVVDDVLQSEITGTRAAAIYQPYPQVNRPFFLGHMSYFVRSTASPSAVAEAMRDAVRTADPNLPVHTVAAMDALVAAMTDHPRFQTWLLGTFALVALALAGIGVYGVLAYAVVQRRFEIGLRMALGARRSSVAGSVLRGSLLMTAVGVLLGAVGALVVTRALRTYLFQVAPMDPAVFIAGSAILSLAALLAGWLPARRAAQVDPATVLKSDY
jgi:predicted permease